MTTVSLCYAILALVTASVPTPEPRLAQATQTMKSTPVTITATIEAIDKTNRIVTLKGPRGNLVDTYVDETFKRFDQLKVGDQVKAQYSESLAMSIRKPGGPAPAAGVKDSVTAREGAPGATAARQVTASVTVTALDPKVPSISVKGPKGNEFSMRVQDPKRLEGVKVGDTIDVTYTQALLIAVDPMK